MKWNKQVLHSVVGVVRNCRHPKFFKNAIDQSKHVVWNVRDLAWTKAHNFLFADEIIMLRYFDENFTWKIIFFLSFFRCLRPSWKKINNFYWLSFSTLCEYLLKKKNFFFQMLIARIIFNLFHVLSIEF